MKKQTAIQHFGSLTAVAKALGISVQAVHAWPEEIPIGRAYQLQVVTGGQLKAAPEQSDSAA